MRAGVLGTGMVGGALATKLADLGHDVFLCGDDAAAKGTVVEPLWLRLWNAVGSADFNFKIQTAGRS